MDLRKVKFALLIVMIALLTACTAPATEEATLPATETSVPATEAPTNTAVVTFTSAPTAEPTTTNSPTAEAAPVAGTTVSFAADILPLLQRRCLNCHGGNRTEEGLSLRSYADVLSGSDGGPVIVPGDAASSTLVDLIATQKMPKRGPKLTPDQVQLITDWVNEGALNN